MAWCVRTRKGASVLIASRSTVDDIALQNVSTQVCTSCNVCIVLSTVAQKFHINYKFLFPARVTTCMVH